MDPRRLRVATALMLMLAYGAGVGGLLTPIGSPPNLIGRGLIEEATDETITFAEWFIAALPVCLAMFVALAVVLLLLNKPEVKRLEGVAEYVAEERRKMGPLSVKERNTLIAFVTAVTLWIVPRRGRHRRRGRVLGLRERHGPPQRGRRGDPGRVAAVHPAHGLEEAGVHADLGRGVAHRLGHDRAVRLGHHLRRGPAGHGPGRDDRAPRRRSRSA
jgi:hypothetical protein